MIEVVLPPIPKSLRAPVPLPERDLVIGTWSATGRWVADLRKASAREAREALLEACPDDPRAEAMRRKIGTAKDLEGGRTWRQRIAASWMAEAYDTRPGSGLGPDPNPGHCHGYLEDLTGGSRLVSIPLLRALAALGAPVFLERGCLRSTLTRPDGTRRSIGVTLGILERLAKKPHGCAYFPEIGRLTKKDP